MSRSLVRKIRELKETEFHSLLTNCAYFYVINLFIFTVHTSYQDAGQIDMTRFRMQTIMFCVILFGKASLGLIPKEYADKHLVIGLFVVLTVYCLKSFKDSFDST